MLETTVEHLGSLYAWVHIDLNPVRADLVDDPKDYRCRGYAEPLDGSKQALRALCVMLGVTVADWQENGGAGSRRLLLAQQMEAAEGSQAVKKQEAGTGQPGMKREEALE